MRRRFGRWSNAAEAAIACGPFKSGGADKGQRLRGVPGKLRYRLETIELACRPPLRSRGLACRITRPERLCRPRSNASSHRHLGIIRGERIRAAPGTKCANSRFRPLRNDFADRARSCDALARRRSYGMIAVVSRVSCRILMQAGDG